VKKEAGILGTLLFLLYSYPLVGDPTPEPTATPEGIPTPHKNSSGLDRAIQVYTDLIHDTPDSASAYAMRGAARFSKGDYDEALADAEQALTLDPHCISALNSRASIRQRKRRCYRRYRGPDRSYYGNAEILSSVGYARNA
jgi:tetratricopeptide (TPR) repeat protein